MPFKFTMKMLVCFIAVGIVFSSCKKEEIKLEQKLRLDRKLEFHSKTYVIPITTWKYFYDDDSRISKIIENNREETLFFYDIEDNLINKKRFDPESNQYYDSIVYHYSNGNLVEQIKYSLISEDILSRVEYEYDGLNLIRKIESRDTTRYEYDEGLCIKEISSIGNRDEGYIIHQYSGSNRVLSSHFTIQAGNGYLIQQIYYTYDEKNNLVIEESIQKVEELSTDLNYIYVYKYEPY